MEKVGHYVFGEISQACHVGTNSTREQFGVYLPWRSILVPSGYEISEAGLVSLLDLPTILLSVVPLTRSQGSVGSSEGNIVFSPMTLRFIQDYFLRCFKAHLVPGWNVAYVGVSSGQPEHSGFLSRRKVEQGGFLYGLGVEERSLCVVVTAIGHDVGDLILSGLNACMPLASSVWLVFYFELV